MERDICSLITDLMADIDITHNAAAFLAESIAENCVCVDQLAAFAILLEERLSKLYSECDKLHDVYLKEIGKKV